MKRAAGWLCQLALLALVTFVFIVLCDHGTSDFLQNARQEFGELSGWLKGGHGGNFPATK